jgi:predicted alpha/beta-fold hydrolase
MGVEVSQRRPRSLPLFCTVSFSVEPRVVKTAWGTPAKGYLLCYTTCAGGSIKRRDRTQGQAMHLDFRPLPFLANPHLQTLIGNVFKGALPRLASMERHVLLADGDRLALFDSVPAGWRSGMPLVLVVHGLGGSHRSGYAQRLAGLLLAWNLRVVRMDLRGAGRGAALARGSYNAGCSNDVRAALEAMHAWNPGSPLVAVGFSLGGNIVLKLAGEAARRPVAGLERVVAVAPPIDLEGCAARLARPRNRLYDRYFVRGLTAQVRRQQHFFPELRRVRFPRSLTLRLFDELYTAPWGGYADALDYYRKASALALVPHIAVPTFILTARDDPFIPPDPFETLPTLPHVEVQVVAHGGHLGFLGPDGAGGIRWAEQRVAAWIVASLRCSSMPVCPSRRQGRHLA